MTKTEPRADKTRLAQNLTESHEVFNHHDDTWLRITSTLHVTAPMNFVRVEFADNTYDVFNPKQRIRSRIASVPAPSSVPAGGVE